MTAYEIKECDWSSDVCSSDLAKIAGEIGADFINKNSVSLSLDIKNFIYEKLGFGDFVFTDESGKEIAVARTLLEFVDILKTVPDESLLFHARRNDFSTWAMARGEISYANFLELYTLDDFETINELREIYINAFNSIRNEELRGSINKFHPSIVKGNDYIVRLGAGSLGGKGRGLAFISNFIENIDFPSIIPELNIKIPPTSILGINEFEVLFEDSKFYKEIYSEGNIDVIRDRFLKTSLSDKTTEKRSEERRVGKECRSRWSPYH